MELGELLYVEHRKEWRSWLTKNHKSATEIWLVYYKKHSRKKRIPYNDAVEEALCFGWIDSTTKPVDNNSWAQRFTPRRPKSALSELNKERVRRLIKAKKMTKAGLASIAHHMEEDAKKGSGAKELKRFVLPHDILKELKRDPAVWNNFQGFPEHYKHIRVAWIDGARKRPKEFQKRLRYFIKMTAQNKKFGMVQ
ncbi:MAG TPA: YdeI/OmpD-associated family protein [Candidatus Kapabacteria bacterium]|nr:YdeI/OmpD-associated family protein [Candidatus Kapabacteria bacterium]